MKTLRPNISKTEVCVFIFVSQGVMTVMKVHTLLLGLSCPMEHHHSWFLSELNLSEETHCHVLSLRFAAHWKPCSLHDVVKCCTAWSIGQVSKCWGEFICYSFSRPGTLKRGMTSLMEESTMKRSRTSSISSGNGVHSPRGTPGTTRNPIQSSYSSTLGLVQVTPICCVIEHLAQQRSVDVTIYHHIYLHSGRNRRHQVPLCPAPYRLAVKLQREPQKDPGMPLLFSR